MRILTVEGDTVSLTVIVLFAPLLILGSALVFAVLASADLHDRARARPSRLRAARESFHLPRAA